MSYTNQLARLGQDTLANLISTYSGSASHGMFYHATDKNTYAIGLQDGSLSDPLMTEFTLSGSDLTTYVVKHGSTFQFTTNSMFKTSISGGAMNLDWDLSAGASNAYKVPMLNAGGTAIDWQKPLTVDPSSTTLLSISDDNVISVSSLLSFNKTYNNSATSLADWMNTTSYDGTQDIDLLVLDNVTDTNGGTQLEMHLQVGNTGTSADFVLISIDPSDQYIKSLFSGGEGLSYNNTTGEYSLEYIKNAGDDLQYFHPTDGVWYNILHNGNMGVGSGIDADTLDGFDSSVFVYGDNNRATTAITGSGVDADAISKSGFYYNSDTNNTFLRSGIHIQRGDSLNFATQIYQRDTGSNDGLYFRQKSSGVWDEQKKLWDDSDFTQEEIGSWNTAYGWGDHGGLYADINHIHSSDDLSNGHLISRQVVETLDGDNTASAGANTYVRLASFDILSSGNGGSITYSFNTSDSSDNSALIFSVHLILNNTGGINAEIRILSHGSSKSGVINDSGIYLMRDTSAGNNSTVYLYIQKNVTYVRATLSEISKRLYGTTITYDVNPGWSNIIPSGLTTVAQSSGIMYRNNTVWHEGNHGSGSGLDSDLLDGREGSYYLDPENISWSLTGGYIPYFDGSGMVDSLMRVDGGDTTEAFGDFKLYSMASNDMTVSFGDAGSTGNYYGFLSIGRETSDVNFYVDGEGLMKVDGKSSILMNGGEGEITADGEYLGNFIIRSGIGWDWSLNGGLGSHHATKTGYPISTDWNNTNGYWQVQTYQYATVGSSVTSSNIFRVDQDLSWSKSGFIIGRSQASSLLTDSMLHVDGGISGGTNTSVFRNTIDISSSGLHSTISLNHPAGGAMNFMEYDGGYHIRLEPEDSSGEVTFVANNSGGMTIGTSTASSITFTVNNGGKMVLEYDKATIVEPVKLNSYGSSANDSQDAEAFICPTSTGDLIRKSFSDISDQLNINSNDPSRRQINQSSHGLSLLDVVYFDGTYSKSIADNLDNARKTTEVVVGVTDTDNFMLKSFGYVTISSHGLTVGEWYCLSTTTAGDLVLESSLTLGVDIIWRVCFVLDANTLMINISQLYY